jgi:hypothetical protein
MFGRILSLAILCTALALLPGCGSGGSETAVTGAVTYNGAPVESGVITFSPIGGGTSFGAKIEGGKYRPDKVYSGEYRVMIMATQSASAPRSREEAQQQGASPTKTPNYIPENAEGNGQTVEIKPGDQTLDFALTGPPRK